MAEQAFNGFTPQTFQFFRDLKENNYKEWFDAHKPVYESEVLNPMKQLFLAMAPAMSTIDPMFEMRPHRAVSRIYRDIRFSKDKTPYRDCMWFVFQKPVSREEWKDYPGYFLEVSGATYTLGMGLFQPKKKVMDSFRDALLYAPEEFQEHTQKDILDRGYVVKGEEYKRPIPNELPDYFQPWFNRKGIWVEKVTPLGDELYSPAFAHQLVEDFKAMEWFYGFLKETID